MYIYGNTNGGITTNFHEKSRRESFYRLILSIILIIDSEHSRLPWKINLPEYVIEKRF